MKRGLETTADNNVVDLASDEDDIVFSAATDAPIAPFVTITKVKTRWLKNGRNEGALMTLNLRELRDEAKRLGFEATYSKVDTKDKYVTYLHKKFVSMDSKSGSQTEEEEQGENAENQERQESGEKDAEKKKEKEPAPKPAPDPPKKEKSVKPSVPNEPKAKKSKVQSTTAAIRDAVASTLAAVMTSKSGPAAGSRKKTTSSAAKSPGRKEEKVSEEETKLLGKLEEFFGGKRGVKGGLPENDWSTVNDIESLPLINIGGWTIQYPCDETVCRKIIEHCKPAPFGRGNKTVIDKTVRDTWNLDASEVDIQSTPWLTMFKDSKSSKLLEEIREKLTPKCKKISAKLYKLLVYEKGSFFKTHKDTQREERHFGTIVVFLPSAFKGGDLIVRHIDKERVYSFSYSDDDLKHEMLKCRAVSFFTEVEHEVKPVESGYRVALTYNLYFEQGSDEPSLPASITEAETRLNKLLEQVFALPNFAKNKKKIGIVLQHDYTMLSLKPDLLKGEDKVIYDAFMASGNYEVELTPISVDAAGSNVGDDEASEPPKAYYDECINEGYEVKFKIRGRDFKTLLEREERKKRREESEADDNSEDEEEEEDEEDEDYLDDIKGELLSDFTWNYRPCPWSKSETPPAMKGSVHFVNDWRKVAVGKVTAAGTTPTGNTGTDFELQYHSAAMLLTPKEK